ncbi:hypothetical protein J8J40_32865, partial [Mycobacterium tuberculosis]|nr:hypothetical protein [Mycobacterium tuberculosis]
MLALAGAAFVIGTRPAAAQQPIAAAPFERWVELFRQQAEARGVSRATYTAVMSNLEPDLK